MGILSFLSGKRYSEIQEQAKFREFTNDECWDVLLDMLYGRIEKQSNEWHGMNPEQRDVAAIRQTLLYELLNDISVSGGRVERNAVVPFAVEEESAITPHRHLGVPHFRDIERQEAETVEKEERDAV